MKIKLPKIIFITGTDGAGKSSMAGFLNQCLKRNGYSSCVIWARFHNYFSKPLLALARLSGHNYYKTEDGVKFGFHDFQNIPLFAWLFVLAQAVDVNIAAFFKITIRKKHCDVLICERGPWDTLSDVMVDTGVTILPKGLLGRLFSLQTSGGHVFYIQRSGNNILSTRPELLHDKNLYIKKKCYDYLSSECNWCLINNDGPIELARAELLSQLFNDSEVK